MNDSLSQLSERDRNALRSLISEIDGGLAVLVSRSPADSSAERTLASSWERLTKLITPEPEPEMRACPHCHARVMRAATRCLHCWKRSEAGSAEQVLT